MGQPKKCIPWNKGKKGLYSDEYKRKIGASSSIRMKNGLAKKANAARINTKRSQITKDKLRLHMLGENNPSHGGLSEEHRQKLSISLKGKVPWNRGENYIENKIKKPRNDTRYKEWHKQVLKRDNYTCQMCFTVGGFLHADHIESFANNIELRFDVSNGRALCRPCHYYVTFKSSMPDGSKWGLGTRTHPKVNCI